MTVRETIQVNDVGTLLTLLMNNGSTVLDDLASATVRHIILYKPSGGTPLTKDAALLTDGTDGYMYYKTEAGDISQTGEWKIQGYVEYADGSAFYSTVEKFYVYANI